MNRSAPESTKTGNRTKLSALPRNIEQADRLLAELGYKDTTVHAVELDQMAVVSAGSAFTFYFIFHPDEEFVEINKVAGWPVG